jgi:hypothetical protein
MTPLFIVPLTILPLIVYTVVGWIFSHGVWESQLLSITMVSGEQWIFSLGDLMVVFAIGCLFFEVLKSTSSSSRAIINHILSTIVFVVYLLEFILVGIAAHSVFFILMIISLFDVVAGFSITIKTASRDIALSRDTPL